MNHTIRRPLPISGPVETGVLLFGLLISAIGILRALSLSFLFGIILFAGLFLKVAIYTVWLKRTAPWSTIFGAISGGTPILAGRVLGTGQIDLIGLWAICMGINR